MSTLRHYVTIASSWYVVHAVAQHEALRRLEQQPFMQHVLCMDAACREVLEALHYDSMTLTSIDAFETDAMQACRQERSVAEYCWTVKAPFLRAVLQHAPGVPWLVYLDADLYPFQDLGPVWQQLERAHIVLTPHHFSPGLEGLDGHAGRFNAGMVCARNTASTDAALAWWTERNLEWCFNRHENGKLGDQRYLVDFPRLFHGVEECADRGVNVAPWNLRNFSPVEREGAVWLDETTVLRLYHYHQYVWSPDAAYIAVRDPQYVMTPEDLRLMYDPYAAAMQQAYALVRQAAPGLPLPGLA